MSDENTTKAIRARQVFDGQHWHDDAAVLVAGFASGMFLAPIIQQYFEFAVEHGYAIGLLLGVIAMPFFAGFHALANRWKNDPLATINELRGASRKGKRDE